MDERNAILHQLEADLGIVTEHADVPEVMDAPAVPDCAPLPRIHPGSRSFLVAYMNDDEDSVGASIRHAGNDPGTMDRFVLHAFSVATRHWREKKAALDRATDAGRNLIQRTPANHIAAFNQRALAKPGHRRADRRPRREWRRALQTTGKTGAAFLNDGESVALSSRIMRFLAGSSPDDKSTTAMANISQEVDMENIRRIDDLLAGGSRIASATTARQRLDRRDEPVLSPAPRHAGVVVPGHRRVRRDAGKIAQTMLRRAFDLESQLVGVGAVRHRITKTIERTRGVRRRSPQRRPRNGGR